MRKFDPWPVFFKREWNRNWPFLTGFAITGFIITKMSLGLTATYNEDLPLPVDVIFCNSNVPPLSMDSDNVIPLKVMTWSNVNWGRITTACGSLSSFNVAAAVYG
ncbi:hypothetical protein ACFE04_001262 [Oxalis oulophora]